MVCLTNMYGAGATRSANEIFHAWLQPGTCSNCPERVVTEPAIYYQAAYVKLLAAFAEPSTMGAAQDAQDTVK